MRASSLLVCIAAGVFIGTPGALAGPPPLTAPPAPVCAGGQRLNVGVSCAVLVDSRALEVALPVALVPGQQMSIRIPPEQAWSDAGRPAVAPERGDDGQDNHVMRAMARLKRMPRAPYMALGAAVSTCGGNLPGSHACAVNLLRLSTQPLQVEVTPDLEIGFFANDVHFFNLNNRGAVWVVVQRTS